MTRLVGDQLWIRTAAGELTAKRAVSCLVAPRPDDQVLVASSQRGTCWVLAVLERPGDDRRTEIEVDGDLTLRSRGGRTCIAGQVAVDVVSAGDIELVTPRRFNLTATEGNIVLESLSYVGETLRSELGKIKLFARTFDAVLERFSQRAKRSYRTVEQHDQLRAASIDHRAESTMCLRGQNTVLTAQQLVKIDGEQIHVG